jgi:UDP-N-acetylmuramoylalanine--D-glutamate ligase
VARVDGRHELGALPAVSPVLRENAAAAAAAALAFGAAPHAVAAALAGFRPLPHRGEVVAEVDGVRFVNDSKATNPHAALASIRGHHEPVLIAGGLSKGVDLSPLAEVASDLRGAVVLGEAADDLAGLLEGRTALARAASVEEAVRTAFAMAGRGGTVLLAPACASQDMFLDYRERGERFAAAARALEEE